MRTLITALVVVSFVVFAPGIRAQDYYHDDRFCCCGCCSPGRSEDLDCSKLDRAWYLYEKGRNLANDHCLDGALSTINEAIQLQPRIGRFHLTLGLILRDQGKRQEAIAALRLAKKYGFDWVEDEAYWALKDMGEESQKGTGASSTPGTEMPAPAATTEAPAMPVPAATTEGASARVAGDQKSEDADAGALKPPAEAKKAPVKPSAPAANGAK